MWALPSVRKQHAVPNPCVCLIEGFFMEFYRSAQAAKKPKSKCVTELKGESVMADNHKIAAEVLKAVGGKANISNATHCMTRLRLTLKDESLADTEAVKGISGVIGQQFKAGQYQVIIGTNADKVYKEFARISGLDNEITSNDTSSDTRKKLTLKSIGTGIMDVLSGSLTPIIPVVLAASIFKMIVAVFGPDMLGVLSAESDLYVLFTFVGDAGYYFFPLLLGYTSAKKMDVSPVLGIFMGAIMLHPTMVQQHFASHYPVRMGNVLCGTVLQKDHSGYFKNPVCSGFDDCSDASRFPVHFRTGRRVLGQIYLCFDYSLLQYLRIRRRSGNRSLVGIFSYDRYASCNDYADDSCIF